MAAAKMGFNAKAYRLSTGTRAAWPGTGAPSNLAEVSNIKDVTIPIEKTEVDATTRASGGWEIVAGALRKAGIDLECVWDTSDTHVAALITALLGNTTVAMAFLDGDKATVGTQGIWADLEVLKMEKMEPINGIQMVKFNVKAGYSAVPPAWVTVA